MSFLPSLPTYLRRELRHRMRQAVVIAAGSPWESPW